MIILCITYRIMASKRKIVIKKKKVETYEWDVDISENITNRNDMNDLNKEIIDIFEALIRQITDKNKTEQDKNTKTTNNFRKKSLQTAVTIFKDLNVKITSESQLSNMNLKGIGSGILKRVKEILETGTLEELDDEYKTDARTLSIKSLTTIYSIGDVLANKLYDQCGIKSAEELLEMYRRGILEKNGIKLTHQLSMGLKYYNDFRIKIPYDEIKNFRPIIENVLNNIDNRLIYEICGSHRRKKALSGDIDILVAHLDYETEEELDKISGKVLHNIVNIFKTIGIIVDDLAGDGNIKYMGIGVIDKIPRHIDIMIQPIESWPTAIMHATGSDNFNIKMRNQALKLGYRLSEKGLFKIENGIVGERIKVKTELDIFKVLRVKYLEPFERELSSKSTKH